MESLMEFNPVSMKLSDCFKPVELNVFKHVQDFFFSEHIHYYLDFYISQFITCQYSSLPPTSQFQIHVYMCL